MGANTSAQGTVRREDQSSALRSAAVVSSRAGHSKSELGERAGSPAVCVIEDDLDLLSMMATALRDAGYHVIEAKDGAQFLRTFGRSHDAASETLESSASSQEGSKNISQETRYHDAQGEALDRLDVLVTDNRMPSISGLSVLEKARERNWVNDAILVSAYVDEDVRAEASRLGASVLPKPFSIETLLAHVGRLAPLSH